MPKIFSSSSLLLRVLSNSGSQFAARLIASAVTFTITVILARRIGASGYGEFAIITAYIPLFYLLSDAGWNAVFVRDSGNTATGVKYAWSRLFSARLSVSLGLTLVALVFAWPLIGFIKPVNRYLFLVSLLVFLPTIFFQAVSTTANAWFQKHLVYSRQMYAVVAGSAATFFLAVIAFYLSGSYLPLFLLLSMAAGSLVTAATALFFVSREAEISFRFDFKKPVRLFSENWPLALSLIFNMAYFRADLFLLAGLKTSVEVGIYAYAYKFFEFILVIPTFVMNSVFPLLSDLYGRHGRTGEWPKFLVKLFTGMFFLSLIVLFFAATGSFILPYFAPQFIQSRPVFTVLSFGLPLFFMTSITMWLLVLTKSYRELVFVYGVGLVFNIISNMIIIPLYSYQGAAAVTVVTEGITLVLSFLLLIKIKII